MRNYLKQISAVTTISLMALAFIAFGFAIFGNSPAVFAASASSDCTNPTAPTGSPGVTPNSTLALTVVNEYAGITNVYSQSQILALPACWSYGGFRAHASGNFLPDDYGNYTGVPMLTLVNLAGGMEPGQSVVVTSGTDGYAVTYTYQEVESGLGWGSLYSTYTCAVANACSSSGTVPTVPMYLVLAYLWNGSDISAYSCTSGTPYSSSGSTTSCTTVNGGTGPLRTVTLNPAGSLDPSALTSSGAGYLLSAGAPWNKAVTLIQITGSPSVSVPEFGLGTGLLAGTGLALALGFVALFAVRGSHLSRIKQQSLRK